MALKRFVIHHPSLVSRIASFRLGLPKRQAGFGRHGGKPKPAELNRLDVSITGARDGRTGSRPSPAESRHRRLQTRPEVAKQQSKSSDQRWIEAWSRRPKLANK